MESRVPGPVYLRFEDGGPWAGQKMPQRGIPTGSGAFYVRPFIRAWYQA